MATLLLDVRSTRGMAKYAVHYLKNLINTLIQELLAWVPQEHNKAVLQSHRYLRYHACAYDQNRAINWEVHNASSTSQYGVYASGLQADKEPGGRGVTV